jgi:flagellar biosynthesis GTPase FlhF
LNRRETMRIKSYFVGSVNEGILQAREELGEDALLLNARKGTSPDGSWVGYEVVFGSVEVPAADPTPVADPTPAAESKPAAEGKLAAEGKSAAEGKEQAAPAANAAAAAPAELNLTPSMIPAATASTAPPAVSALSHRTSEGVDAATDLVQLRAQIDEIHSLLLSSGSQRAATRGLPFLGEVHARLMKAGWSARLAGSIVDAVAAQLPAEAPAPQRKTPVFIGRRTPPNDWSRLQELLRIELSARVKIDPSLGSADRNGVVVAMVGPGGAGKTTMLMKIAAIQADPIRPIRLLTLDGSGTPSRMHLQMFARSSSGPARKVPPDDGDAAGHVRYQFGKSRIAFTPVEEPEALPELIEEARKTEIVLIDTPGHLSDAERGKLASILTRCPGIDVHLVLPAYMTSSACREAIQKYAVFWPSKLSVTRFDETPDFLALVPEAAEAGLSLSLVSNGVSIPDSLHALSIEDLMIMVLGRESAEAACA